jgi:hypothetical protein
MEALQAPPFSLSKGDSVVARVQGRNAAGYGVHSIDPTALSGSGTSLPSQYTVKVKEVPSYFVGASLAEQNNDSFKLEWDVVRVGEVQVACSSDGGPYLEEGSTSEQTFEVTPDRGTAEIACKVRQINECGGGPYSEPIVVPWGGVPGSPQAVMYQTAGCDIQVDWIEPDDNGARITAYKIEIQNSRSQWVEWVGRCVGQTDCTISMQQLAAGTQWDLAEDTPVRARVLARNLYGWSTPGNAISSGIRMGGVPPRMVRPSGTVSYPYIEICWDSFHRS